MLFKTTVIKLHDDKDLLLLFVFWYLDSKGFVLSIGNEQYSPLRRFKNENNPDTLICLNTNTGKKISVLLTSDKDDKVLVYFETFLETPGRSKQIPLELKLYIDDQKKDVKERMEIVKKLDAALVNITEGNKKKQACFFFKLNYKIKFKLSMSSSSRHHH
ncbi:unnamed protein product [Rotaria sordida]|uniref:Uncharacterized protein n=2 Tax=Rotaria sordida TaxID=392033 RepID=A0A819QKU2_9BILA|nr:unnamed protein product [Rotaria sordida]